MISTYMSCPFVSQYADYIYTTQPPYMQGQYYPQQYMPMLQYLPMQTPYGTQGSYGMQEPDGMYDDTEQTGIIPGGEPPRDPPPVLSNNPATTRIVLFKELTAYPNYGNPSRNADILYTGNRGTWTFDTPAFLFVPGNLRASIVIRAVLDDHANVPVSRYSARITINGNVVHDGRLPLQHGVPAGQVFTNWTELPFNIVSQRRTTRVTIENTSTAGPDDWVAFDWMELRYIPR